MKFVITFTQDQVQPARDSALKKLSANLKLKGFRQGKAPLDLVDSHLDPERVINEVAGQLIPDAYAAHIKEHQLKPIAQPRITVKKVVTEGDWEFEIEIAQKPTVTLNAYEQAIKTELAKDAIWTPGKDKQPEDEKEAKSKKLNHILETLLKTANLDIPELLIEQEVNHSLSHLLQQVEKLGLKLDHYLKSIGKTAEQLSQEYRKSSEDNLKLEFILDAIAQQKQVAVSDAEIDAILDKTDPETAKKVKNNPVEIANLKYTLTKQKVIDHLLQL